MFCEAVRRIGLLALIVAVCGGATAASAQTCGVLEFAGDGELVGKSIRVKLTALVAKELHGRDECPSAVVIPIEEAGEGCQDNPRCLKKLAKDRGLEALIIGVATDGRAERSVRLQLELFNPKKGRTDRDVEEEIKASKDELLAALPGLATELLTGSRGAPQPEPTASVAERKDPEPERRAPVEVIERRQMDTCGVLEFTGSGQHATAKKLVNLTTLISTEVDIVGHCDLTTQYEASEFKTGCAQSKTCLAELATEQGHTQMIVGVISDGSGGGGFHLRLQLFDANRGRFKRTVDEDFAADMGKMRLNIPPVVTELFTGERPKTAAQILAEKESEDIKLDFEMDNFADILDHDEDVMIFGDEVTNLEVVDLEMTDEERRAKQDAERRRKEKEARRRRQEEDRRIAEEEELARQKEARAAISIGEDDEEEDVDENEIVIEPAGDIIIIISEDDEDSD